MSAAAISRENFFNWEISLCARWGRSIRLPSRFSVSGHFNAQLSVTPTGQTVNEVRAKKRPIREETGRQTQICADCRAYVIGGVLVLCLIILTWIYFSQA